MTLIYCLLALLGVYIFFVPAPAYVIYRCVFRRLTPKPLTGKNLRGTCFEAHASEIAESFAFLRSLNTESVSVTAYDGISLTGKLYSKGGDRIAICFHGYGSTGENSFFALGRWLYERGYDLLLVDQRAHGNSGGDCPALGVKEQQDVLSWTEWAAAREKTEKIILAGVSMGSAGVALAADKIQSRKAKALILDCGYASPYGQMLNDCKTHKIPPRLIAPIMRLLLKRRGIETKIPVWESLEKTEIPAFFLHGTGDKTVPYHDTEINYAHCAAPKTLCRVEGAQHTLAFLEGGEYARSELSAFLAAHVEREN